MSILDSIIAPTESGGDPLSKDPRSTASGSYGILDKTWRGLGGTGSARDAPPDEQAARASTLRLQNEQALKRAGLPVNDDTQILAWNQGPGGAPALLANPDQPAIAVLTSVYKNPKLAAAAIVNNGGSLDMTAGDFAQHVVGLYKGKRMPSAGTDTTGGGMTPALQAILGQYQTAMQPTPEELEAQKQQKADMESAKGDIAPLQQKYIDAAKAQEGDHAPAAPPAVTYPTEAKEAPGAGLKALQQFLPLMAVLGGALMGKNAMAGLKAATGAMKGLQEKDDATIQLHHQQWLDSMTQLKDQHEAAQQEYEDIMNNTKFNAQERQAALSTWASVHHLSMDKVALDTGEMGVASQFANMRREAMGKLIPAIASAQEHQDQLDLKWWLARQANPVAPDVSTPEAKAEAKAKLEADPGIKAAAEIYAQTGKMPSLGMGAAGKRTQILELAGMYMDEGAGGAAGAPGRQAGFHSETVALNKIATTRAQVEQFEGTALKEADLALSLAKKGEGTGLPAFNKWLQAGRTATGDPDVTSFNSAIVSFKNEYARIMSSGGAGTGAATSDSARHEADGLVNSAMSPAQLEQTIATMKQSMSNRKAALDETYQTLKASLGPDGEGGDAGGGSLPTDLPSPQGHPDGTKAKDGSGKVVAVIKQGKWAAP